MTNTTSDYLGLAASATTDGNTTPRYGLAYDLATGSWKSAADFQQFVRDVLPATQTQAQKVATETQRTLLHSQELEKATNYEQHDLFALTADLGVNKSGVGNQIMTGFKAAKGYAGNVASALFGGASDVLHGDNPNDVPSYEEYTSKGGLLSEAEYNGFSDRTKSALVSKAVLNHGLGAFANTPGVKQGLEGIGAAYQGVTTGAEMLPVEQIPVVGAWLSITGTKSIDKHRNPLSGTQWHQAWKEAQGDSLGNAIMNTVLDPYTDQETLDRWKRDNPWYQMSSAGSEIMATWYVHPVTVGGKALGGAARFARGEFPINEAGSASIALRQATQHEAITVHNPVTKAYAKVQARRISNNWDAVEKAATSMTDAEFSQLPMFRQMYRAQDGGAAAYALHWAANNKAMVRDAIGPHVDPFDLTRQLTMGDPKAYAMLHKLQSVTPEELSRIAPGAGGLFDSINAVKTKATVLQQETDDLLREADAIDAGTSTSKALPVYHRWEVHTSLADKQRQLADANDALQKYDGYQNWLDLASKNPTLSRVQGPSRSRFSEVRNRPGVGDTESRSTFMDNQFGFAHTLTSLPKSLFIKRANSVEIHSLDSGIMSINRQFDQFEHMYGYAPEGARDATLRNYVRAESADQPEFERYKILHNLEETHLTQAIAQRFNIEPDMANVMVHKIYSERDKSIQGILSGDGAVFRSAPTTADRLSSGTDTSLKLVSRDADAGTVTVNLMHGRHLQTFEIPEAALERRIAPEDVTQTPNYYNPLDTRRLYHELKHEPQMLDELNAGFIRRDAAAVAHTAEWAGNKFNAMWKPIQLFRLGWPVRVLMDEGARATAIFGPMYWLTGPGAEAVRTVGHNMVPNALNVAVRHKRGPLGISMGDGPVARAAKQDPNPFARAAKVNEAVQVPQELWSKIDPARLEAIKKHYDTYDNWERDANRIEAWRRAGFPAIMDNALRTGEPLTPLQDKLIDYGRKQQTHSYEGRPPQPLDAPVLKAARAHLRRDGSLGRKTEEGPLVFDPARGTQHKTGYVIPLPDTTVPVGIGRPRALLDWYNTHSELLARAGMRLVANADGTLTVGRHFPGDRFKDAQHFAQYVAEKHPDVQMWDLGKKVSHHVQDANDLSPISQEYHRYFASQEETALSPGAAPVEGAPGVYHGTGSNLPENLLPKEQAPVENGRMLGDGLYTTTSLDTAQSYGTRNLYTVRGSKSGKTYKVWDADTVPTSAQKAEFRSFLEHSSDPNLNDPMTVRNMMDAFDLGPSSGATLRNAHGMTWANIYEELSYEPLYTRALHSYLEDKQGVGALTHRGGTTHGHPHQVYVWLKPEDLHVKPAYAGTGNFVSLPQWFSHPHSIEQLVPENQIIRKGRRNPMLRELRTVSHQLDNYKMPKGKFSPSKDPEFNALRGRENELMDALGLARRGESRGVFSIAEHDGDVTNEHLLPHKYVVVNRNHFEKMVNEARTEDQARAIAQSANGDLRAQEVANQNPPLDINEFDYEINSPQSWLFNKMRERSEQGAGWKKISSADGKTTIVPAAFEGHSGQLFRGLTASNGALDVLSEGHGQGTSMFRRKTAGYRVYSPPEFSDKAINDLHSMEHKKAVRYFQIYADTVNDHLGNSPIIQRMSRGESNDKIINWLETSHEGERIMRNVKPKGMPTGVWVDDHRFKFDYYVPSKELQRRVGKGRLAPSDFRRKIADEDLPHVYGPDLEVLDRRRGMGRFVSDWTDKAWDYLGNKPIDNFSRHPFAKAMYDAKMKNLIASTDSKWLTQDTIDRFQQQAHSHALNETRRHLYNLTETTNFNDALRFIAPFWGAQYEAISKWLRIISDRPETLGRFFSSEQAVYNNFVVVDPNNDHKAVKSAFRPGGLHGLGMYHPNDMVIMQMPKFIEKKFGLTGIGSIGIPIGSANTVLQGDLPLFPSLGPLVTIPADQLMRKVSATYGVENDQNILYRWAFPIGRPRSKDTPNQILDQLFPGWANRFRQSSGPEDAQARLNMEMLVGREMTLRNRQLGKADPSASDIEKAANHLWHVRVVAGLIQPFQTQFLPDHQYWLDAAHQMQKQYGNQWWDKFIDKYGEEAAIFATSSSNSVGVPPTDQGMEEWKQNKTLIAQYPNWTSAIISPQAYMGQFSSDAYGQQFNITLGPGDTRALRSGSSLQDRLENDPQTQLGWREYRKLASAIEAELSARGLTSIQQRGAEDLAQIKQAGKSDIATKYPAWAKAFESQANTINSDVTELQHLSKNPIFDNRPDWQGVRQYLDIRQKATDALDAYSATGGSRSLQSQENGALRDWFYQQVGSLILANPAFAEFYSRYLDNDTLTTGSGF